MLELRPLLYHLKEGFLEELVVWGVDQLKGRRVFRVEYLRKSSKVESKCPIMRRKFCRNWSFWLCELWERSQGSPAVIVGRPSVQTDC